MSLSGLKKTPGFYAGKDYNKNIASFLFRTAELAKISPGFKKLPFFGTIQYRRYSSSCLNLSAKNLLPR